MFECSSCKQFKTTIVTTIARLWLTMIFSMSSHPEWISSVRETLGRLLRRFFFPMHRGRRIELPDDAIVKSSFVSRQRITQQRPRRVLTVCIREMRHDDVRASSRQIQLVVGTWVAFVAYLCAPSSRVPSTERWGTKLRIAQSRIGCDW